MKNILISLKMLLVLSCFQPLMLMAQETDPTIVRTYHWKKVKNNSWPGVVNEKTYRYKLDAHAKLWWSADGKKWEEDADGMWADKEGVFYKLDGGRVVESMDGGNTWSETPEWLWEAVDGLWYKLDKDNIVWVSK